MKNKMLGCVFVLLLVVLYGCSVSKTENLLLGKYVLEDSEEVIKPYVILKGNNEFSFEYSVLSSYFNHGTYTVENYTLILTTEDEAYTYVFKIDNRNLYFNLELSSEITEYKGLSSIGDGAKFVLHKDE